MKKCLLISFLIFFTSILFAQVTSDPTDNFYTQVERWESLGLIETQPSLRPYPLPIVNKILNQVIESSSEIESETAKAIWSKVNGRPWGLMLDVEGLAKKGTSFDKRILANYGIDGDFSFLNFLSAGYELEFLTDIFPDSDILPRNRLFAYSMADGYGDIKNYLEINGNLAANFKDWYFQGGINHNTFGPFYNESIVISSTAKHTANFSISYNPGRWNYTQSFYVLSASDAGYNPITYDKFYPNKFLFLHSVDFNVTKWLSITGYETSIFGNRFDPAYLIPMPFMVTQGVTGYEEDNLLMGVAFNLKPVKGLTWSGDFYLDDIGFTGLKEYHNFKLHCAVQTGLKYVPENLEWLKIVKLNYTMVTPYMYSHWQNCIDSITGKISYGTLSTINYQDYKNAGQKIGSALDPNSDKVSLNATFAPINGLSVDVGASFSRHGNVTETLSRKEKLSYLASDDNRFATDGSINQTVNYWDFDNNKAEYTDSAWNKMMILSQNTKEYCFQADIDVKYTFPECKIGKFTVGAGYTFEYIKNYGVGNEMLKGGQLFYSNGNYYKSSDSSGNPIGNPLSDAELDSVLESAISSWKAQLTNLTNHYFRINFKYQF